MKVQISIDFVVSVPTHTLDEIAGATESARR
jgi:hypothetical protein